MDNISSFKDNYEFVKTDAHGNVIDDKLANIYGLNSMELDYLKNFAIKYRMGGFEDEN